MPGSSAAKAREAFFAPLRRCLDCITEAQLFASAAGQTEALTLSQSPLLLSSEMVPGGLQLSIRQEYQLLEDVQAPRSRRWHVRTVAYAYRVNLSDGSELLSWHWQPAGKVTYPHLHADTREIGHAPHLPTGRVSLESVLRLLLDDLAVPARRSDWRSRLDKAEADFLAHRRWHA